MITVIIIVLVIILVAVSAWILYKNPFRNLMTTTNTNNKDERRSLLNSVLNLFNIDKLRDVDGVRVSTAVHPLCSSCEAVELDQPKNYAECKAECQKSARDDPDNPCLWFRYDERTLDKEKGTCTLFREGVEVEDEGSLQMKRDGGGLSSIASAQIYKKEFGKLHALESSLLSGILDTSPVSEIQVYSAMRAYPGLELKCNGNDCDSVTKQNVKSLDACVSICNSMSGCDAAVFKDGDGGLCTLLSETTPLSVEAILNDKSTAVVHNASLLTHPSIQSAATYV